MSTPHVKLLAHMGPVQSISVDPSSSSCGRYMSTSGADGSVKIWDCRNWGQTVREWNERGHGQREVDWSMKGMLAVSNKGYVNVYRDCHSPSVEGKVSPPRLYQKLALPSRTPRGVRFVPFEDILGVGHDAGFSSLLVPGSGLAQFDSNEADVYESKTRRREREVRGVLEKIKPDLITMDADFLGRMADPKKEAYSEKETPFYKKSRIERLRLLGKSGEEVDAAIKAEQEERELAGSDDEGEAGKVGQRLKVEKLKHKMRGRDKGVKKFLRKKRKNVVDPALVSLGLGVAFGKERVTDGGHWIYAGRGQGKGTESAGQAREGEEDCVGRDQGRDGCFGEVRLSAGRGWGSYLCGAVDRGQDAGGSPCVAVGMSAVLSHRIFRPGSFAFSSVCPVLFLSHLSRVIDLDRPATSTFARC